ncbi:hypothetical protein FQR65_LT02375 [Abscondita terminalis]|nr:hypothetical protein FQR65_LT02375 [Abscondita terminalis]
MWYIIVFIVENTVAVVSKSWYIEKTSECFWSPAKLKREELQKFIKHNYLPEDDWEPYTAKILGQYGDYKEAIRKLKKAQERDKLSSTNQDEEYISKFRIRKRIPNSKFRDTDTDSSDKENESDDTLTYPKSEMANERSRAIIEIIPVGEQLKSKQAGNIRFCRTRSRSLSPVNLQSKEKNPSQPLQNLHTRPFAISENFVYDQSRSDDFESHGRTSGNQQLVVSILQSMISTEQKFREKFFRKLNVMNMKLLDLEKQVGTMKKDTTEDSALINEEQLELLNLFPMNQQNLNQIETSLSNQDVQNFLVNELSRIGGTDTSEMVKRLMYKMFTNEVGVLFSWDGAKGKLQFKKLKIANVIFNAVRSNHSTKNATDSDIIVLVKKWLVRCKDRIKNADNKKLRLDENGEERKENT